MKILVVDDSSVQRMLLTRILAEAGHTVVGAKDGRIAVEKLEEDAPDVVVCDIHMPGLDGYRLLTRIAASVRRPVVVVVTSDIHPSTQEKCYRLGAAGFVAKPYSAVDILGAIQRAVESGRPDS